MKKITLSSLDMDNTLFHFDVRDISFIEENGFPANIGRDSKNVETNPKVFFSKGIKGALELIDVWIIWRMNKDHQNSENWTIEFLSGAYLKDEEKKAVTFNNMYEWLLQRKYYKVDLLEGIDYLKNDIDEAKQIALDDKSKNEIPWKYLFAYEMYKGKIKHNNATMEDWNMHTIIGRGISTDKISLIQGEDGKNDALTIIELLYQQYNNKKEFRILNAFMEYCLVKKDNYNNLKK